MKKIFLILFLSACVSTQINKKSDISPPIAENPVQVISNPQSGSINFVCKQGNETECANLEKIEVISNLVVQSECFEKFMKNRDLIWNYFSAKTPLENFTALQNKELTNQQVIDFIRASNFTADIIYYYASNSTVGYTYPNVKEIYFNRKYHQNYGICDSSSNATHEWSHKIGFGHPARATSDRGNTVPYSINRAFDQCCQKIYESTYHK